MLTCSKTGAVITGKWWRLKPSDFFPDDEHQNLCDAEYQKLQEQEKLKYDMMLPSGEPPVADGYGLRPLQQAPQGNALVGQTVVLKWDGNDEWYTAAVLDYNVSRPEPYSMVYEDGVKSDETLDPADFRTKWRLGDVTAGHLLVGLRIRREFPVEGSPPECFAGPVMRFVASTGKHDVHYDNGEKHKHNLLDEAFTGEVEFFVVPTVVAEPDDDDAEPLADPPRAHGGPSRGMVNSKKRKGADVDGGEQLRRLREYIEGRGGDADVLGGWSAEAKPRKSGVSEGQVDVTYISAAGQRFRSRKEVAKHLRLNVATPAQAPPVEEPVPAPPAAAPTGDDTPSSGTASPPGSPQEAAGPSLLQLTYVTDEERFAKKKRELERLKAEVEEEERFFAKKRKIDAAQAAIDAAAATAAKATAAAFNASTAAEARRRERDAAAAEEAATLAPFQQASQDLAAARARRNETRAAYGNAQAANVDAAQASQVADADRARANNAAADANADLQAKRDALAALTRE